MALLGLLSPSSKTSSPTTTTVNNNQVAVSGAGTAFGATTLTGSGKSTVAAGNVINTGGNKISVKNGGTVTYQTTVDTTDAAQNQAIQQALAANQTNFSTVSAMFTTTAKAIAQLAQAPQQGQFVSGAAPVASSDFGQTPATAGNTALTGDAVTGGLSSGEKLTIALAVVGLAAAVYFATK